MGVLKDFRRAADALERIAAGLSGSLQAIRANEPSMERLQDLERSRGLWEAEVEGILAKAEGKLKAAANAEARTRTMVKSYENDLDPFGEDRVEIPERLPEVDADGFLAEEVLPMPESVAVESKKQYALRAKFS